MFKFLYKYKWYRRIKGGYWGYAEEWYKVDKKYYYLMKEVYNVTMYTGIPNTTKVECQELNFWWPIRWIWHSIFKYEENYWSWTCSCPHCGYNAWNDCKHSDLYECTDSGEVSNSDNGHFYWWQGDQTCWRCGAIHQYGDQSA